jgi:hypothetical protein
MLDARLDKLKDANQRIAEGERLIEEQKARVQDLRRKKQDTAGANRVLEALIVSQNALIERRKELYREVELQCLGETAPSVLARDREP